MKKKNKAAQALGRRNRGVKKTMSKAAIQQRKKAALSRWGKNV